MKTNITAGFIFLDLLIILEEMKYNYSKLIETDAFEVNTK